MAERIRSSGEGLPAIGGGIGEFRPRPELEGVAPGFAARFRQRIPTLRQLQDLIQNGRLMLPARYFRGTFLDILV